mmetsp:Transcript_98467/g.317469  ORF Transcript_98467/g.317469 Transcript_98467/m.317469 type:complete len:200 (-) Transcript_98467:762-1361(-)
MSETAQTTYVESRDPALIEGGHDHGWLAPRANPPDHVAGPMHEGHAGLGPPAAAAGRPAAPAGVPGQRCAWMPPTAASETAGLSAPAPSWTVASGAEGQEGGLPAQRGAAAEGGAGATERARGAGDPGAAARRPPEAEPALTSAQRAHLLGQPQQARVGGPPALDAAHAQSHGALPRWRASALGVEAADALPQFQRKAT